MAGLEDIQRRNRDELRAPILPSYEDGVGKSESGEDNNGIERYAAVGQGLIGLIAENLLSHPFHVLRRQCQVNQASCRYHRTPFTLLPVLINLNRSQGVSCLFKGLGSSLLLKGLGLAVEDFTSKFTPWPKEVDGSSSLRNVGQHLMLKGVSLTVLTPFYSASLVETVQSDIASEAVGVLDVFKEGFNKIFCLNGRMMPVWVLVPPTVIHGILHYIVYTAASGVTRKLMRRKKCKSHVKASLLGHFIADTLLYPVETVLHRLHLQGSRTIIDNLDTGREVMPIMSRYEGFFDCLSAVRQEEGFAGLFKGFGALLAQYLVQYAFVKMASALIEEIVKAANQDSPPPELLEALKRSESNREQDFLDPGQASPSLMGDASERVRRRIVFPSDNLE